MNSSNDLYQDLMECVQHASEGVVSSFNDNKELSDSVRSTSQDFMKVFIFLCSPISSNIFCLFCLMIFILNHLFM